MKKTLSILMAIAILVFVANGLYRMGYLEGQVEEKLRPTQPHLTEEDPNWREADRVTLDLNAIAIILMDHRHGYWSKVLNGWADKIQEMKSYSKAQPEKAYVPKGS